MLGANQHGKVVQKLVIQQRNKIQPLHYRQLEFLEPTGLTRSLESLKTSKEASFFILIKSSNNLADDPTSVHKERTFPHSELVTKNFFLTFRSL